MTGLLQQMGRWWLGVVGRLGRGHIFLFRVLTGMPALVFRKPGLLIEQLHVVGVLSLLIIVVSALNVGMVLGLQMYNTLVDFGAESSLGPAVGLALVRELGPVVAALLFAGRAGSALAAEIGLMKATEQLDGMEMMAVDPVRRVVAPRLLAGMISLPLLTAIFSTVGIYGAYFVGVGLLGGDEGAFWSQMQSKVDWYDDIVNGMIKSVAFGVVVTWISVFEGYDAVPTAEGVSRSTTRAVVNASLAVLALDFLLTAIMYNN